MLEQLFRPLINMIFPVTKLQIIYRNVTKGWILPWKLWVGDNEDMIGEEIMSPLVSVFVTFKIHRQEIGISINKQEFHSRILEFPVSYYIIQICFFFGMPCLYRIKADHVSPEFSKHLHLLVIFLHILFLLAHILQTIYKTVYLVNIKYSKAFLFHIISHRNSQHLSVGF